MKVFIHKNCFELFLSVNFLFREILLLNLTFAAFAVYVKHHPEHKPQKDKEISIVSYSARENHTAKLNIEAIGASRKIAGLQAFELLFSVPILFLTKVKDELIYGLKE